MMAHQRCGEDPSIAAIRRKCLTHGISDLKSFSAMFRKMDQNYSKEITFDEFQSGLKAYGLNFSKEKEQELFTKFDKDRSGCIDFQEFCNKLTPPLSGKRLKVVKYVFDQLDTSNDGILQTSDLMGSFSERAKNHPKYISGEWTVKDVIDSLLAGFEQPHSKDGVVTLDEFINYYAAVSAWVQDDAYFEVSMKACWDIK